MQLKHTLEISYKDFIQVTLGDIFVGLCREEDPNGHVGLFLGFVLIEDTRFNINNEHFTCICTLFI